MPSLSVDRRHAVRCLLLAGALVHTLPIATGVGPAFEDSAHAAGRPSAKSQALRISFYYLALESDYRKGNSAAFRDLKGRVLHRGSREFVRAASIEGSAKLGNGQILNYHKRVGKEVRWMPVNAPYGISASGCPLVPLRSAAVDPKIIAVGSKLLIEETRGIRLPDGTLHDGIWEAVDTGDSIKGQRIDLFIGEGIRSMEIPRRSGMHHMQKVTARVVGQFRRCPS